MNIHEAKYSLAAGVDNLYNILLESRSTLNIFLEVMSRWAEELVTRRIVKETVTRRQPCWIQQGIIFGR